MRYRSGIVRWNVDYFIDETRAICVLLYSSLL